MEFVEKRRLPKMTQEDIKNLKSSINIKEISVQQ